MAIQLAKGQRVDLTKTNPGLTKAVIGLGWDTNKYSGGHDFDLDASAFLVDAHDNCVNDLDFVFYNNLEHPSGGVIHTGDNRTGEGEETMNKLSSTSQKYPQILKRSASPSRFMMRKRAAKISDKFRMRSCASSMKTARMNCFVSI